MNWTSASTISSSRYESTLLPEGLHAHWEYQLLPLVMKSAVQSANTVVFVPSSFDFIRVQNHFRSLVGTTHTVLSEWGNRKHADEALTDALLTH